MFNKWLSRSSCQLFNEAQQDKILRVETCKSWRSILNFFLFFFTAGYFLFSLQPKIRHNANRQRHLKAPCYYSVHFKIFLGYSIFFTKKHQKFRLLLFGCAQLTSLIIKTNNILLRFWIVFSQASFSKDSFAQIQQFVKAKKWSRHRWKSFPQLEFSTLKMVCGIFQTFFNTFLKCCFFPSISKLN